MYNSGPISIILARADDDLVQGSSVGKGMGRNKWIMIEFYRKTC